MDDEETIHRALQRTFRREPFKLLHAYDAAEAWGILERHPEVDLIICDHYMPGTHGLDLIKDVRARHPRVTTILLTAQADLNLVISAINEGRIHRFFTKPWDNEEMRRVLNELLYGGNVRAQRVEAMAEGERRLAEELLPRRDETTGAFIIEAPDAS